MKQTQNQNFVMDFGSAIEREWEIQLIEIERNLMIHGEDDFGGNKNPILHICLVLINFALGQHSVGA